MSASGSSITYGCNADGKRISKTANGTTCNYAYLGDQLTEMTWGSNKLLLPTRPTGIRTSLLTATIIRSAEKMTADFPPARIIFGRQRIRVRMSITQKWLLTQLSER